MREQRLLQLLGEIDERYITGSLPPEVVRRPRLPAWTACLCMTLLTVTLLFGAAMAVSADFRKAVRTLLFPVYAEDTLHEITQGRRTGSFDRTDTLLTFLDRFNREGLEPDVQVKQENGFACEILCEREERTEILVECENLEQTLIVNMVLRPYEETTGLWQVVSYQVTER